MRPRWTALGFLSVALASAACGGGDDHPILPPPGNDARTGDGGVTDAATLDGMPTDGTPPDAPVTDAGDGRGPKIVIVTPLPGSMAAGVITLTVEITDADGVDAASIKATFADVPVNGIMPSGQNRWSAQSSARRWSWGKMNVSSSSVA